MPPSHLLILVSYVQQMAFGEVIANDLHPDWEVIRKPNRQGHAGKSGQVDGDGINVGQIHRDRVCTFFAEAESDGGRGWPHDDIDFFKCALEIIADQPADFLRFQIIGILITGG